MDTTSHARGREPFYGVYEPGTRTLYTSGMPSSVAGMVALLDAVLQIDCSLMDIPPLQEPICKSAGPSLAPMEGSSQPQLP